MHITRSSRLWAPEAERQAKETGGFSFKGLKFFMYFTFGRVMVFKLIFLKKFCEKQEKTTKTVHNL